MAVTLRTGTGARSSRIMGLGTYRPHREVSNTELCEAIDSTEEWIETRSGIIHRRFAGPAETLRAMATSAGRAALAHAGLAAEQVDCVVLATLTNLVQTPPGAFAVARDLGAVHAAGFDLSGACAGFCQALAVASDAVCLGNAEYVLVIGAERMTDVVDPSDRTVAFMFADGAGAVVVGPSERPGIGPVVRGSDTSGWAAVWMSSSWTDFADDPAAGRPSLQMDGRKVFRWAVDSVVPAARCAVERAGIGLAELSAFIPHQANLRIVDLIADRLELPSQVAVARDAAHSGNTSAASVPLAMDRLMRDGGVAPGDAALLMGFGAGLNYAGQVVLLPPAPADAD
ncbi:3-oxoacyl-[acyl-carrier-protein] synthase-3/beta-ketoacyl ACP synthase [Amycolatopsis cihanbeyliensis]|uniref:3-oxoacyl-[acyl-carrier-protein] synthase-3/beta-ketoacyl ACP synthase n=1 Tax=Amycolatopsis cihanbeyliensis TaxID=1128664 RepID=A0A542DBS9_AMYCI|nr:3-oxoacyl-[acyl-carrier-protein] synthase-3/beta-ketoacyl ACP synthase [Amycolatopsis cihanbeyliensis]